MTDLLQLDLLADGEGLLVPFRKAMEKADTERNDPNPLFAPPPVQKKRMGLFFRRSRENQPDESKDNGDEKLAERRVKTKQALTFSFPNAPHEYAGEEQSLAPIAETGKESFQTEKTQSSKEDESEDESEEESSENVQEKLAPVKPDIPNPNAHDEHGSPSTNEEGRSLMQDDLPRPKMDGFGNTSEPQNESTGSAVGRLFRHLRKTGEMKTMKIATEATKDERTIGETVTHCLQLAIAPEIYAEDMEGEGNLGFYRILRPPPPLTEAEKVSQNLAKWKSNAMQLRARVKELLARIETLEGDLKIKDLEAASWKLRARELEYQLKRYQDGVSEDDSLVGPKVDENRQSESEIDHEKKEDGTALVKEEILVDTDIAPEKIEFDPLSKGGPAQSKDDEDESKDLVDLILSLSADVDTFKAEKVEPNENNENTSSPKMPEKAIVIAV